MNVNELYLKTIFCCMACDGDIAKEELALVSKITLEQPGFAEMDIEAILNSYVTGINEKGTTFLTNYLKELSDVELTEQQQLCIVDFAVQTIVADSKIEYTEVKFFKKIRSRLSLTDEEILEHQKIDVEDWLLPDIRVAEEPEWKDVTFENIKLTEYEQK